jgi:hypothetical protein
MTKVILLALLLAISASAALAEPVPIEPTDKPVIKQLDGDPLLWEVPSTEKKPKEVSPEEQRKINQALYNQGAYMQQAAQQNILPPPSDGTAPGAITPPFLPYSTVPGGPYNVSGTEITPFNNRSYSYGGTSQSFGAPMFYGNEIPNPALAYPINGFPQGTMPLINGGPIRFGGTPNMPATTGGAAAPSPTPTTPAPTSGQPLAVPRTNTLLPPDSD